MQKFCFYNLLDWLHLLILNRVHSRLPMNLLIPIEAVKMYLIFTVFHINFGFIFVK